MADDRLARLERASATDPSAREALQATADRYRDPADVLRDKLSSAYVGIQRAVDYYHGDCDDANSCDVSAAMRHGYYLWAAHLLSDATDECPKLDKAWDRINREATELGGPDGLALLGRILDSERDGLCDVEHLECSECNAVCWDASPGDSCGNCLAILTKACAGCGNASQGIDLEPAANGEGDICVDCQEFEG
jgi:hypothetical protein